MSVRAAAEIVALDMVAKFPGSLVTVVAFGSSDDFADWITVDVRPEKQSTSDERIEWFAQQLTRYGIVLLTGMRDAPARSRSRSRSRR